MSAEDQARERLVALERRIADVPAPLPDAFHELREHVRAVLLGAQRDGLLDQAPSAINRLLRHQALDDTGKAVIEGGARAEAWDSPAQFQRDDGARFNFTVVVSYSKRALPGLLAYHFNLSLPPGRSPDFLRFDWDGSFAAPSRDPLRSPLLCHFHPVGDMRLTVPSPLMSPLEILDLFLRHLR